MRVVVTGANGFIGREIVANLLQQNHEVISFVGQNSKKGVSLPKTVRADISDFDNLKRNCEIKSADVVIHTAGLAHQFGKTSDEDFLNVNFKGTENVARLAVGLGVKHFILISSVAVYGNSGENGAIDETRICNPKGIYATSKLKAEEIAKQICEVNHIPLTILRPTTVIGENDRGNTKRLIEAIDQKRFVWIGSGENRKSLIYKKDVALACVKVLDKKTSATEVFNVTSEALKMKSIVEEISRNLNQKILPFRISPRLLDLAFKINKRSLKFRKIINLQEIIKKWVSDDVFSGDLIKAKYGFEPETKISDALARQTQFYIEKNKKKR